MKRALLIPILFIAACAHTPQPPMLDLKITNGRIIDGSGAPWFRGEVGIKGNTIVAVGDLAQLTAATTVDAHDRIVAPGFIDLLGQSQQSVLTDPHLEAKVRQGVTTEVTGEGTSPGPIRIDPDAKEKPRWISLGDYLDLVDRQGSAINFALLVGASNPREIVIGEVNRPPTETEMRQMEDIIDRAMRDGAIGLSTSLIYLPAMYSTTDEIVRLARVAARYDGMYFTHMRDEGDHIDDGLDETFRIGREAKIPVNIWHLKVGGRTNWGRMPHVIERIEAARREGIDAAANVYPYPASSTGLSTLVPNWALEGGYAELQKRLRDPRQRPRIAEELRRQFEKRGERGIYVARIDNPELAKYEKKFVEQIAAEMGVGPEEAMMTLYEQTKGSPNVIFFSMSEDDVQFALRQPWVSIGADSGAPTATARARNVAVHPRAYGTFARVAGHYVRDVKLFSLEEAVRKMSSQAAARAHLYDRGVLRAGMKADVIIFDAATISDPSTFDDPHHFAEGVSDVFVNGVGVLRDGKMTAALPGRTIRGKGYRRVAGY
ncbi:MAG TPA: D-aminoacylase [Thermoanaerobaculia bacterium]|nr:D-aminoacylase [Thermoanaerobaculia bacterium]